MYAKKQLLAGAKTNVELELKSYFEIERAKGQKLQNKLTEMEEDPRKQEEKTLESSQAS